MRFDILTLFPEMFASFLEASLLKKAHKKGLLQTEFHNFRKYGQGRHQTVDDRPYGGGPGMILKPEPIYRCLKAIQKRKKSKIVLLTPTGKAYNQRQAEKLSRQDQLIIICGRYEGFDERIRSFADLEISIGDYILMGGEVAAMALIESIARLRPGVLGKHLSVKEESFSKNLNYLEYPQYTRPPVFRGKKVPAVLLSGDHKKIKTWRSKNSQ